MSQSGSAGASCARSLMQSRHVSGRQALRGATASSSSGFDFA
jgi:hypothetical protein